MGASSTTLKNYLHESPHFLSTYWGCKNALKMYHGSVTMSMSHCPTDGNSEMKKIESDESSYRFQDDELQED